MLLDKREQLERRAGGPFFAALPLADQTLRHIEVPREYDLAYMLALAKSANRIGRKRRDRRQAAFIKPPHSLLVDQPGLEQARRRFVNRGLQLAARLTLRLFRLRRHRAPPR